MSKKIADILDSIAETLKKWASAMRGGGPGEE